MTASTPSTPLTAGQPLTAEQLAARWQVPRSWIYHRTREGVIPAVKLGRYYRYRTDAIERFEHEGGLSA